MYAFIVLYQTWPTIYTNSVYGNKIEKYNIL